MADESRTTDSARLGLRSLSVRNLRSLQDVHPVPIEADLTILAGQNGGGKTSFIDALSLLLDSRAPSEEARSAEDEDITVAGVFGSADETDSVTVRATHSAGRVYREVLTLVHPAFGDVPESMTLQALREAFRSAGINSPGGPAKGPFIDAAKQWIAQRPSSELEERWITLPPETASRLPGLTVFRSQDADDQPESVRRLMALESRRLLRSDAYKPRLDDITRDLQAEISPVLEGMKESIKGYCPDLADVQVAATFDFSRVSPQVQIQLKKISGESIDLNEAGSGLLQRVGLAIYAANLEALRREGTDAAGTILAYDEPDTHLDYQAQRDLFGIVRGQAELPHAQVLLATHSVNLIDKVQLRSIRHFRLEEQKTIVDRPSSYGDDEEGAFVELLASGLGLRNSVLLSERCFLVVEGETEERALPILFKKATSESLAGAGITLLNTGGSGSVRGFVEILIQQLRRMVVVLVDEDARESPGQLNAEWLAGMGLVENTTAFFAGEKEFEDAFDDPVWLRVAEEHFPNHHDEPAWELRDFTDARGDEDGMGDALIRLFRSRAHRNVTKPQVGEALARTVTDGEIPEVVHKSVSAAFEFAKEA